jgi:PAS domain S-box-containing protein
MHKPGTAKGPPQAVDAPRYEALVQHIRDYSILMLDVDGYVISWNEGAQAIQGYAADEIIGQHFSKFYPAEAIAANLPRHELEVAAAVGRYEEEGWRLRKDGSLFWANVVITRMLDERGQVIGFSKITRDLSERRKQDLLLRESEERFRLLVGSVKDYAIFMLDPTGHVLTWNVGAEFIKGYSAEEIIGSHFSRFYPPEAVQRGLPEAELRGATLQGRYEDEGWRVRKDGSRFWANVVISAVRNPAAARGFLKITAILPSGAAMRMHCGRARNAFACWSTG